MQGKRPETREADIAVCFPTVPFYFLLSPGESFHNEVTEDASLGRFHGSYKIPDGLVSLLFSVPSTIPPLWLCQLPLVNNTKCSRQTNIAPRFTGDAVPLVLLPYGKSLYRTNIVFFFLLSCVRGPRFARCDAGKSRQEKGNTSVRHV